jgi:hypothetical protein
MEASGMRLDSDVLVKTLDLLYDKALDGLPEFAPSEKMVQDYSR